MGKQFNFIQKAGFKLIEDKKINEDKRWVRVAPDGSENNCLLLAKASTTEQKKYIGNQSGGRVFLFLHTDNFGRDYEKMKTNDIHFLEQPREEEYGIVVVFEDLYGNKWDLVELKNQ